MNTSTRRADRATVRQALAFLHPSGVFEIRALRCRSKRGGKPFTAAGWFNDHALAAAEVARIDAENTPEGVYVTLNPVHPDLLARQEANKLRDYADGLTTDADILARHRLLIDFDPARRTGISSTEQEHKAAFAKAGEVAAWLKGEMGFPDPLKGDSGNGAHLLCSIDLPNDAEALDLVQAVLLGLKTKWDSATVAVDEKVFNASRITKLYGTVARKGADTHERPHRLSRLWAPTAPVAPVPRELLEQVAALRPAPARTSVSMPAPTSGKGRGGDLPPMPERIERARKYLSAMPPSIEGQGGSKAAYRAALALVRDFALGEQEALELMLTDFNPRSSPPWLEKDLRHKIADAARKGDREIGSAYRNGNGRRNGQARPPAPAEASGEEESNEAPKGSPYFADAAGTFRMKPTRDGEVAEMLANFSARIVGEVADDDGAEVRRSYEIEATLRGSARRVTVGAMHFGNMNWTSEALGAGAIVSPGFGAKDHLRAAIQVLSGPEIPRRVRYSHLGWREIDGEHVYLHGGGAIGAAGAVAGIEVALTGALALFVLPPPPEAADLRRAIRASMAVLEVAHDEIAVPLWCALWRSVLGATDFSLHVSGATGRGKSEHAALVQQHFGPGMVRARLPLSWSSTANALEGTAFGAADAVLTVDDFAPSGGHHDVTALHRVAERLVRNAGNGAGRARMNADGSLKPVRPPRCLILSTGEDVPRGASIRARLLVLEHPGVDFVKLARCQAAAAAGLYAQAMSGFVRWLAPRIVDLRRGMPHEVARLRGEATRSGQHRRTPGLVADLMMGLDTFVAFAGEVGALTTSEAAALRDRAWSALGKAAQAQAEYQAAADPVRRYLELLGAAVASGRAHVADLAGGPPGDGWGWRNGDPCGDRIAWLDGDDLLLEPDAAYAVAQRLAGAGGESIGVSEATLRRRLHERGLLTAVEREGDEARLAPKRTVEGRRLRVLVLRAESLSSGRPGQPGQDDVSTDGRAPESAPVTAPETETGARTGAAGQGLAAECPGCPGSREGGGAGGACYSCGGSDWWTHRDGGPPVCRRCHPPASGAEA